jgi:hypothetical protein
MYLGSYNVPLFGEVHVAEDKSYRESWDTHGGIRITGVKNGHQFKEGYKAFDMDVDLELDEDGFIVPLGYDDERWGDDIEIIITSINKSHKESLDSGL